MSAEMRTNVKRGIVKGNQDVFHFDRWMMSWAYRISIGEVCKAFLRKIEVLLLSYPKIGTM